MTTRVLVIEDSLKMAGLLKRVQRKVDCTNVAG